MRVINDILDFSKIEAKKLELETVEFDLRDLLDGLASALATQAQGKGIELLSIADPAIPDNCSRRSGSSAPGPHQPGRQRHQIH